MPEEDVTQAGSSPAVDPQAAQAAGTASEPVSSVPGDDRPVQNVVAEFNRKFGKLQQQYDTLMQYVATQAQARPAASATSDPTEDELWSLAQQGNRDAFKTFMRRIAAETGQQQSRVDTFGRMVQSQLSILAARYPVFNDASHPLTQQVNATYSALVNQGYTANQATLLEAMKTAIADRPDLVSEMHQKVQPASLRRDRAQAGVTGTTTRDVGTSPPSKPISKELDALGKRMGVKDPGKSMERFYKRQEEGKSALGAVASYLKEE